MNTIYKQLEILDNTIYVIKKIFCLGNFYRIRKTGTIVLNTSRKILLQYRGYNQ